MIAAAAVYNSLGLRHVDDPLRDGTVDDVWTARRRAPRIRLGFPSPGGLPLGFGTPVLQWPHPAGGVRPEPEAPELVRVLDGRRRLPADRGRVLEAEDVHVPALDGQADVWAEAVGPTVRAGGRAGARVRNPHKRIVFQGKSGSLKGFWALFGV